MSILFNVDFDIIRIEEPVEYINFMEILFYQYEPIIYKSKFFIKLSSKGDNDKKLFPNFKIPNW